MTIPAVIPIQHEPGHRTDTIGHYQHGQFFASVTATLDEQERRWYAVLHLFDRAGRHRSSRIEAACTAADGLTRLGDWLAALPGRRFADIALGPFAVHHEGQLFGLVVEEDREWVELYPDRLGFSAPWDGLYDT
ncbi:MULTISPECIES: hypothetical protein [unclassified Streptomyces]|uniref:hypothetical protein n=1 Tax=unclassified Streptomyces TaxID=2593676 RepID=UPI001908E460|nr:MULTISPECIES: hypothetical protein [unclassified Streptomyces]MCU4748181.1 hypothetical protein [Streptomyces sp. G-5]QQN78764.1 hypothetical protein IPZ77_15940 [Streptomyces sp. XC 2026]